MISKGNKVIVRTVHGGMFHGRTGVVKDAKEHNMFVLVKLDNPIIYEGRDINEEIFYPSELFVLKD